MLTARSNTRRPASVSFTFFFDASRAGTPSATSVYFDSAGQDRSMTVDGGGRFGRHVVVAARQ